MDLQVTEFLDNVENNSCPNCSDIDTLVMGSFNDSEFNVITTKVLCTTCETTFKCTYLLEEVQIEEPDIEQDEDLFNEEVDE